MQNVLWAKQLHWVVDIDIHKYFDSIPHSHLRAFLDQQVTDGVIRRMIDKMAERGSRRRRVSCAVRSRGLRKGASSRPVSQNIFLHYVLDRWFETEVKPRLHGESLLVQFADDAIMAFDNIVDAQRILAVLGKRLERFGLTLRPDKTRLVDFRPLMTESTRHPETDGTSFVFLGFAHIWGRSRKGKKMVRQIAARAVLPARWPRRAIGVGNTGTCRYASSIATFPQ